MLCSARSCAWVSGGAASRVLNGSQAGSAASLRDDIVDARGDHVVVPNHRGDAAPLADLRVVAEARAMPPS